MIRYNPFTYRRSAASQQAVTEQPGSTNAESHHRGKGAAVLSPLCAPRAQVAKRMGAGNGRIGEWHSTGDA